MVFPSLSRRMPPQDGRGNPRFVSRIPRRHSQLSSPTKPVHSNPFRNGHPNPLICHPVFNDKHPDYIRRQGQASMPKSQSLPLLSTCTGSLGLSLCTHGEHLEIGLAGDHPFKKCVRVDSLIALDYPYPVVVDDLIGLPESSGKESVHESDTLVSSMDVKPSVSSSSLPKVLLFHCWRCVRTSTDCNSH